MKPEEHTHASQEALNALADAGLGNDSPADAFIIGYEQGRAVRLEITDKMIDRAVQVLESDYAKPYDELAKTMLEAALTGSES